jgi:pimeloyl-ACP methyl ester carboxylesterase
LKIHGPETDSSLINVVIEVHVTAIQTTFPPRRARVPAGTLHIPAFPKIPDRAKLLWHRAYEAVGARLAFLSLWLRRGLGLVKPRTLDPALLQHGLTLVLPGIESESVFTYGMCDGLHDGGVPGAIRVFNWGLPFPGGYLANLTRIDRNRRRAADIAREICLYQDAFPGRPVHLVAQSGGAGIAVFAAEALPEGRQIDSIVLLGAALSPTYNLARALARTRKGLLNSYSTRDTLILGWGTRIFGTTDRKFTPAAGSLGFQMPANLSHEETQLYNQKLIQLPWMPQMADTGRHYGGHISCGCETHLTQNIAPWMTA